MAYVVGFDGGGTKTRCIIGDDKGNILGDFVSGGTNYQTFGLEKTKNVIGGLFNQVLEKASLKKEDISFVYLGLAGADLPFDYEILNKMCMEIFTNTPFMVMNDAWISMRSGLTTKWGAVSICGTGANAAARSPEGKRYIIRSLDYELGSYGGGSHLTERALHKAFRASEGTGKATLLEKYLPPLFGVENMDELLSKFYPYAQDVTKTLLKIPPLVFDLANKRDAVCQEILIDMGNQMGEMMAGVIKKLGIEDLDVPVVLGGSLFQKGSNPLLVDEFTTMLHKVVPRAYIKIPFFPPVAGAYLSALDELGIEPGGHVYENLKTYL